MSHPFAHLRLILRHRHQVMANGAKCGIFWHCLKHDLSKFSYAEFHTSAKYYAGDHSPVLEERKKYGYYSAICQHHTKRNPHHWEYWTDFIVGRIVVKTMPWKYATEYVCDMLAASKTYNPKQFKGDVPLKYFMARIDHYYMTKATKEYIKWCLTRFSELGFDGLKKKDTKAKYAEIITSYPGVELIENLYLEHDLPSLK